MAKLLEVSGNLSRTAKVLERPKVRLALVAGPDEMFGAAMGSEMIMIAVGLGNLPGNQSSISEWVCMAQKCQATGKNVLEMCGRDAFGTSA